MTPRTSTRSKAAGAIALGLAGILALAGCGSDKKTEAGAGTTTTGNGPTTTSAPTTIRLGYFPNITHAPALIGVNQGIFQKDLGADTLDASKTFNAGPAAVEALLSGAIDATFIGPGPSVNAFQTSKGAVRVIAGVASGGAGLVVKPEITSVDQLKGKTIADPQLGGTQDIALRAFLKSKGLNADTTGGGDVHIKPQDNSQTIDTFKSGDIDGAWVPEPFLSRLIIDGKGSLLVDEKTLWPDGKFVTTNLLVTTKFLNEHPTTVQHLLEGLQDSIDFIASSPDAAAKAANDQINKLTQKPLSDAVLASAFKNLTFTTDPLADTLRLTTQHGADVGLLKDTNTEGIYDVKLLNAVLKARGKPEVKA